MATDEAPPGDRGGRPAVAAALSPRLAPPPPGLFWFRGQLRARRIGVVKRLRRLKCPDGHVVRVHGFITGDYGVQCSHRDHAGAEMCGAIILLVIVPRPRGRRSFWAADVHRQELDEMTDLGLDGDEMIHHLGGSFPE